MTKQYKPLQEGDEIRIIAPSMSRQRSKSQIYQRAQERLERLGYTVSFGENTDNANRFGTAPAHLRAQDFNRAVANPNVKALLAIDGGWSANELLPLIDWQLLAANPKPLIGFSDITVLHNAIYAKTGSVSLLGPNFGTIGKMLSWKYTLASLECALKKITSQPTKSAVWGARPSDRFTTTPWKMLSYGTGEGVLIGGNLGTFYLLQGTEYQPQFTQPFIFALEDDDEAGAFTAREVARRFESLLQLPGFRENLKGMIIGRFQPASGVSIADIRAILDTKELSAVPIVGNVDFGHTLPLLTLPIGGCVKLKTEKGKAPLLKVSYE